jgi:hypothetical protein
MGTKKCEKLNLASLIWREGVQPDVLLTTVVHRMCGARPGQWCVYGRIYTANGRAAALDPAEARNGLRIQCQFQTLQDRDGGD